VVRGLRKAVLPIKDHGAFLLIALCVLILTIFVYQPGMQGGFYFDDLTNIVRVQPLHWTAFSWQGISQVAEHATLPSRLVANLSFAFNHLFGGLDPSGYHWTNLVIHLLVGAALIWVASMLAYERLDRDLTPGQIRLYAAVAAAVFLVHPLNIQAVTYVVQRMTSLSALFVLLSFGCYLLGRRYHGLKAVSWFCLSFTCWILGLLNKEIAVVLPLLLLAYELCFHSGHWRKQSERLVQRFGLWRLLIAMLLVISLFIYVFSQVYYSPGLLRWSEIFPGRDFSGEQRVLTQARIHFFYFSLLFWPAPSRLNLEHDFPLSLSLFEPWTTLLAVIGLVVISIGILWLVRRHPRYGFPLLGYGVSHLLESAPLGLELVFEHRMYLPMFFLVFLMTNLLVDFAPKAKFVLPFWILILIPLSGASYERNLTWSDPETFLRDCAAKSPNKFRPSYNLGTWLGQAGQLSDAEQALSNALQVKPDHSQAHNQLGNIYLLTDKQDKAFLHYLSAYESDASNYEAMFNLATLYLGRGERAKAAELFRRFIQVAPYYLDAARRRAMENLRLLSKLP